MFTAARGSDRSGSTCWSTTPEPSRRAAGRPLLWGLALDQRLRDGRAEAGAAGVDVQLTHPGWAATGISNATGKGVLDRVITSVCSVFAQPAAQAALTTMCAATRPLPPCSYTGPDAMRHLRGMPTRIGRSAEASEPALGSPNARASAPGECRSGEVVGLAERLWDLAETKTA